MARPLTIGTCVAACLILAAPLLAVFRLGGGYHALLARPEIRHIIGETLLLATITAITTLALALPATFVIRAASPRVRAAMLWTFVAAGFTPFLVRGYAFVGLLGGSPLFGTATAVVITMTHAFASSVVLILNASIPNELEAETVAASALGSGAADRFLLVTLPRIMPAVTGAIVFVVVTASAAFVAPALVGGGRETLAAQLVYSYSVNLDDLASAAALSVILTLLALSLVLAIVVVAGTFGARTLSYRILVVLANFCRRIPTSVVTRSGNAIAYSATLLCLVIVTAPLVYVVLVSFQPAAVVAMPRGEWSLRWYRRVINDDSWLDAALTTLRVGLVAGVMGSIAGYAIARTRLAAMRAIPMIPAIAPAVMFAIGIYRCALPLHLAGSEFGVMCAHAIMALPLATVVMTSSPAVNDDRFDQAAAVLGAPRLLRFVLVRVPMLLPAFTASFLLTLLLSIDEVIVTLFMAGATVRTIALRMWTSATQGAGPELAVPGTLLLVVTACISLIAFRKMTAHG